MRALLPAWTVREARAQYRQSAFDLGWSLLTPVITLAGFGFVLTKAFGVTGEPHVPYLCLAWVGLVVWTFVSNALVRGASSLVWSAELVRKVWFPREVVPLATVFAALLDLLIGLVVLAALMVVQGVGFSVTAVAVVPVGLVIVIWTTGVAIILAMLTAFVRDLAHALAVVLRIGIFVTPVMYKVDDFPAGYRWLTSVNPIAVFIEGMRDALLRHRWPHWSLLGAHFAVGLLLLGFSLWYTQRVEGPLSDVI